MSIRSEFHQLARTKSGSHDTIKTRHQHLDRFSDFLREENIQIRHVKNLRTKDIQRYCNEQLERGKAIRTIQNELASLRYALRESGRFEFADSSQMSNKSLGISGASREGTNRAITQVEYQQAKDELDDRGSHAESCALGLMYCLGLRSKEAVMSDKSLDDWERQLERGEKIRIVHGSGTKGDRPRDVRVSDREAALEAVREAVREAKQGGGHLINGQADTLKSAYDRLQNELREVLPDDVTPHSARYAFAQNQVDHYRDECGYSDREAYCQASLDLGHGADRWRYIRHVYDQRK
jgi:Site-specific recombinase XerD